MNFNVNDFASQTGPKLRHLGQTDPNLHHTGQTEPNLHHTGQTGPNLHHTGQTGPNSRHLDDTAITHPGANSKGNKHNAICCDNTRTVETVHASPVSQCETCGEDLSKTPCQGVAF